MTVAHVIHSLGAGGAEAVLVELARVAPSAGIRLIVIGLSEPESGAGGHRSVVPRLRELGAIVYEMHSARYNPVPALTLARLFRAERVDIVHTHLKHADVIGGVAARLAGVPSVSTLHVIDIPASALQRLRVRAAVLARRWLSSTVIAVSNAQREWYSGYAGPDAPVTLLPNGVSAPEPTRDRATVRAELGVADDTVLGLCLSLMRPEKGHADLVEAMRRLPGDTSVVVAMAGDGPLLNRIDSMVASDPELQRRCRVLGFRRDSLDLLAAADFVVQPSLEDALPTALISALAYGRPIVATRVGGIAEIVAPQCGQLVEAGHPAALSGAIVEMAATIRDRSAVADAMRQAARERYHTRFSSDIWIENLRALYGRTMTPRRIAMVEFPPSGGLFQFSLQLGEALARSGSDVELITGPAPELSSREKGCRVRSLLPTWHPAAGSDTHRLWRRARRGLRAGRLVAAWMVLVVHLVRARPDVVMWSEWRFALDGWAVHLVRRVLPNAILALVAHEPRPLVEQPGQPEFYKNSSATSRGLATAHADLDVAFVLGEQAKKALTETWPIAAPVHVIPHGDESIFCSETIVAADTTGPVALSFGTITKYKGFDTLCDAWPKVRAQVPDAELVIAGAVSADVDEAALRTRVDDLAGVTLRAGYVPVADVASYFSRARCVVLPYKRSSQSGVAHLALTFSRPVVATHVGDIPNVVRDGQSGILVAPDDADGLAGAVIRLLTDAELAAQLGNTGNQALTASASWDHVAAQLLRGLDDLRSS
ncbi:glycosyltransferase [Mycolicibacterium psychrotolerans]|nr:glycosyltransferase [Mycolicibacterium psychrotolerans]